MKTKYVKVPVSDRLPEKSGNYTIVTFSKNVHYEFRYDNESEKSIELWKSIVDWFLEEVPDHSEEMLDMLEIIKRNGSTCNWAILEKDIEKLINKVKDNG